MGHAGCGGLGTPADTPVSCCCCCCCSSARDDVPTGVAVALLESSSATGEQVSPRTHWARPWRPLPLRLPSLLHSRLEPLRSSFSEELVMVAGKPKEEQVRESRGGPEHRHFLPPSDPKHDQNLPSCWFEVTDQWLTFFSTIIPSPGNPHAPKRRYPQKGAMTLCYMGQVLVIRAAPAAGCSRRIGNDEPAACRCITAANLDFITPPPVASSLTFIEPTESEAASLT